MKKIILLSLFFLLGMWIGLKIVHDPGQAYFSYASWSVEMPLWFFLGLFLFIIFVLNLFLAFFRRLKSLPKKYRFWKKQRQQHQAEKKLQRGIQAFAKGQYAAAEKYFLIEHSSHHIVALHYLFAAMAAKYQQAWERSQNYLDRTTSVFPEYQLVSELMKLQIQFEAKQFSLATESLSSLLLQFPHHPFLLKMAFNIYQHTQDYAALLKLLPTLYRDQILLENELTELLNLLVNHYATWKTDAAGFADFWRMVNQAQQQQREFLVPYLKFLTFNQQDDEAFHLLSRILPKQWESVYIDLYGQLKTSNLQAQLAQGERWLLQHADDSHLLFALSEIAKAMHLEGKAKEYYDLSKKF